MLLPQFRRPRHLDHILHTRKPRNPILTILLNPRLQQRILNIKIVNSADPRDTQPRIAGADAIHERAAVGAEVVGHGVTASYSVASAVFGHFVLAADVDEGLIGDDEVGGECRGRDLMAVRA